MCTLSRCYWRWAIPGILRASTNQLVLICIASGICPHGFAAVPNAVFVLARYFGTGSDYTWATGLPDRLRVDAWNVRLIAHYGLSVLLILVHMAGGLQTVMLAPEIRRPVANAICWAAIGAGAIWAALVIAGMVGLRL